MQRSNQLKAGDRSIGEPESNQNHRPLPFTVAAGGTAHHGRSCPSLLEDERLQSRGFHYGISLPMDPHKSESLNQAVFLQGKSWKRAGVIVPGS
jgi:hypothetical protein